MTKLLSSFSSVHHAIQNLDYNYIAYTLGVIDILLFFISCVQLTRIILYERFQKTQRKRQQQIERNQRNNGPYINEDKSIIKPAVRRRKWSGKLAFHAIITCCLLVRGLFFLIQPSAIDGNIDIPFSVENIWEQAGSALYVCAYFMLLIFWAQFYHQVDGTQNQVNKKFKIPLTAIFVVLATLFGVFCCLSVLWVKRDEDIETMDEIASSVLSFISLCLAIGFMYYGVKLYLLLRRYRLPSARKRSQTQKVVGVAIGCTFSFLARSAIIFYSDYSAWGKYNKGFSMSWVLIVAFFFFLETLPIAMMMFLLRKLPSWKVNPAQRPLLS